MIESNLRVVGQQIEIVEVDEVPELDGDPLGAGEARLVQRQLELPVELKVPEQVWAVSLAAAQVQAQMRLLSASASTSGVRRNIALGCIMHSTIICAAKCC